MFSIYIFTAPGERIGLSKVTFGRKNIAPHLINIKFGIEFLTFRDVQS